MDADAPDP